jgi:hypothetical protein
MLEVEAVAPMAEQVALEELVVLVAVVMAGQ